MKRFFCFFCCFAAIFLMIACGGGSKKVNQNENSDTEETVTDEDEVDTDPSDSGHENPDTASEQPDNGDSTLDGGTDTAEEMQEGIYLGIIGFNYKLYIKNISLLTTSNMPEFHAFIDNELPMDDATALYYADYEALKMMQNYNPVPPKLANVALVTFTDGEDTSSDGPNDPENYGADYPNVIHDMIVDGNGIHGRQVEAYSIGLRSGDTGSDFMGRLRKLASSDSNAFEVSDMTEVKARFNEIAENLYHVFKTVDIDFKVLGNYLDGTRMRFTFDIYCDHSENTCEKNGINSKLYIEATYRRPNDSERSFEDFSYYGFSGSLTSVKCGARDEKGFYPCKFENLQYNDMNTEIKQIELWKQDGGEWKHENESLKKEESAVHDSKSSALIMLVLDCTTSLGLQKFEDMKKAAKDFITTLVNGVSKGSCGDRTIDNGEVCDGDAKECSAVDASFTGGYASCKTDCTGYDTSACKSDNGGNGGGSSSGKNCAELAQCALPCQDQTCFDTCLNDAASQSDYNDFATYYNCLYNNQCTQANCQECANEYNTCMNGGGNGGNGNNLNTGDTSGNQAQTGKVGAACTNDSQCTQIYGSGDDEQEAVCLTANNSYFPAPNGYCTFFGDSSDHAACDSFDEVFYGYSAWSGFCFHKCTKPSDCRVGYRCSNQIHACLPDCSENGCYTGTCDATDKVCL